jgi:hypothetical protein
MHPPRLAFAWILALCAPIYCWAQQPSVDDGECSAEMQLHDTVSKSPIFSSQKQNFRAYGTITFRRSAESTGKVSCHVVYRLYVAAKSEPFRSAMQFAWDTEEGEIAGIDLIGLSKDGSKFAADFWLGEGDSQEHRAVVYDLSTKQATQAALEDKIQKRIHSCDHNEDFIAVTNDGEAVFAVPPSIYDDSPECGDKGLWHLNLKTGNVTQVKKFSGIKWR